MNVAKVLSALADLSPAGGERVFDVSGAGRPLIWLEEPDRAPRNARVDRLAALDALHRDERILRRGLSFVVGSTQVGGARRKVCLPLLAQPVRLERGLRGYRVVPAGDFELTPLIEDRELAALLESTPEEIGLGWLSEAGTAAWIETAARAAGLPVGAVVPEPPRGTGEPMLTGVAAAGLFVVRDVVVTGLRNTLLAWAQRPGLESTALARVYDDPAARQSTQDEDDVDLLSPLPLSVAQREVVHRVRTEPLVVVSGPPGSGKSHALIAAALDVVHRGGSVLVATQSVHAADVLAELLDRYPGPTPILFGDAERRDAIAEELSRGSAAGADDARLRGDDESVRAALDEVQTVRSGIAAALDAERRAAALARWQPLIPGLSLDAPDAFAPDFDLTSANTALARATSTAGGWWSRWRISRAAGRLRRMMGAGSSVPLERLRAALAAASAAQAAARLAAQGGTDLAASWGSLTSADDALSAAVGAAMRRRATSSRRWSGRARRNVTALGAALRAGRNRRREMLAALDGTALVRALPLWIGTVADVEDLLPPIPGMFDLVVLDEAAHIDQIRAAPVLARARRALISGDPRQLRFVSFVADVDVTATLSRHGLDGFADRLDVRRVSAFDLAAGAAPATWLGEHYRSAPHLIEFSARRFYADRLELVTRHPANERADVIDVVRVADATVVDGVNRAEVDAVVDLVRARADEHPTAGIAVITPFRAQADALEGALLANFSVDEIDSRGLRSGTVHSFQGSEADLVIASLGLVDEDSPGRHRFAADPNLFNVMITRARGQLTVVTSLQSPTGIIGDYLRYAAQPPTVSPVEADPVNEWAAALADELRRARLPVRLGYPVGRWRVDLCLGSGPGAVGLICDVHPDGVDAHVERQRTLLRAGWRLHDAFPSRWSGDPVRAALDLAHLVSSTPPVTPPGAGSAVS